MSILDTRTGKTVADMEPLPIADWKAKMDRRYRLLLVEHFGRWIVTHTDETVSYIWGDELLFLP